MKLTTKLPDPETIYLRLPTMLQHLGCSFIGWRTERTRYAGDFPSILSHAEARTYWSAEEIRAFRDHRLAAFIAHAATSVPFYRDWFARAGLAPSDIRSIEDLVALPILIKEEAKAHAAELDSVATPLDKTRIAHTSGTTGGALRFRVTMRAIQEQWAMWWRYLAWHGIRKGVWCALFAGRSIVPAWERRPPFWRINYPGRQIIFSGYHVSSETLPAYLDELKRRQPRWLHGYPSLLTLIAAHMLDNNSDIGYEVKWITIGSENLLPHQSLAIERAFGVKPLQHYGLTEGVANFSECELGALHVDEDFAAVEFVPLGKNGLHRIIGTNFTNLATPFIRYDAHDLATIREQGSCSCGRPGRVVERVDGRLEDYVVLNNGARLGRLDHIFKDMVNIHEAQIYQAKPGEMTIRVVRRNDYRNADEEALLRETRKRVGNDMYVRIEYVNSLPRSSAGKLRFVVSEIPEESLEVVQDARS
jgi:phenylacetate-CoA ligase